MAVIRGSNYQDDDYEYEDDFPFELDDMDGCFYEDDDKYDKDFERYDSYGDDYEDDFDDDDFDDFPY